MRPSFPRSPQLVSWAESLDLEKDYLCPFIKTRERKSFLRVFEDLAVGCELEIKVVQEVYLNMYKTSSPWEVQKKALNSFDLEKFGDDIVSKSFQAYSITTTY